MLNTRINCLNKQPVLYHYQHSACPTEFKNIEAALEIVNYGLLSFTVSYRLTLNNDGGASNEVSGLHLLEKYQPRMNRYREENGPDVSTRSMLADIAKPSIR